LIDHQQLALRWPAGAASRLVACEKDERQPVVLWTDVNNQDCRRDGKANQSIEICFVSYRECNEELT